jgi:hypothetical protein
MLKGKNKKINSDPFFLGAIITISRDKIMCIINTVQVDLKSIFAKRDFLIVGKTETATITTKVKEH